MEQAKACVSKVVMSEDELKQCADDELEGLTVQITTLLGEIQAAEEVFRSGEYSEIRNTIRQLNLRVDTIDKIQSALDYTYSLLKK